MKKLIGLLTILSLFSFVACNMDDRQEEEVRGMETTDERVDRPSDEVMEDQRMEDTYQETEDNLNQPPVDMNEESEKEGYQAP